MSLPFFGGRLEKLPQGFGKIPVKGEIGQTMPHMLS